MRRSVGIFLIGVITLGIGFCIGLFLYLGGTKSIALQETTTAPFEIVYKEHDGAYNKILSTIEDVEKWARVHHVSCDRTFGEFLDDPNRVEEARLQAYAGCIVTGPIANLPPGYLYRKVPALHAIQVQFSGSPAIGPWKVYPKAFSYMKQHRLQYSGSNFEIYRILSPRAMETTYIFPVK